MFQSLIAIDYGKARIGIASGQMITKTATPIGT
ncbi:crossover junction endodeoxyribonuclease RuvA, partial [Francisella tularensis subsp. holarctica]